MFLLFKEANLPRHLTVACLVIGSATFTMTSLPGTPQLTNVIPTQFLGTTMTAAPVLGIICSIVLFVGCMLYANYAEKKAVAAGETWSFPEGVNPAMYEVRDRSVLPAAWKAFLPMIALILFIIIGSKYIASSALLTVLAMIIGAVLAFVLNLEKFKSVDMKKLIGAGLGDGITAIGGLAAVVAFGTVVQKSPAFGSVIAWVLSVNMHPYWMGIFSTAVISGITGSSSGGLRITLQTLGETFVASGCNLGILHRLMAIAAGSLDTLPHASGLFLLLGYLGLTHKESYRHVFVTSVAIPAVTVIVATAVCVAMGL
jgi:H+/gluconate symporter-like permease